MSDKLKRRAIAWGVKNLREGQYADECRYVKSGWAVHGLPDRAQACLCRQVPKTYAPYLTRTEGNTHDTE